MRMVDIIQKQKEGLPLTKDEINFMIEGYVKGDIPDYQMSAWAMAVYFKGMSSQETAWLTEAMVRSGEQIDLSEIAGIKVDKHSTGGVGDKTSLVLAPLVAAVGGKVAKMSGRGLGHTGGTIDKLESIPGFKTELSRSEFVQQVNEIGLAIVSQSADLTPADKSLYALRDVTSTVDIIPLIASSIMSKKIAAGADAIVLDVKVGNGAFMKREKEAEELARTMVSIGVASGKKTVAVISDMNQPLGYAIGNVLEVKEAIETLRGNGPEDLTRLCLVLGSQMLILAEIASNQQEAEERLEEAISNGTAVNTFRRMIEAQQGDPSVIDDPESWGQALYQREVVAPADGWITAMKTEQLGLAAMELGAGRAKKDDMIDVSAGIILKKKRNDYVKKGELLAILYSSKEVNMERIADQVSQSFEIGNIKNKKSELIYKIINNI